jgi:hypothetical protein
MFDTVAISSTFARLPDIDLLERKGCKPYFHKDTGEPYKLVLNGERGCKEPRLTISTSPKGFWIIKAEVSIGAWLYDSNLFLPDENDMKNFFPALSEFVCEKTSIKFEAWRERVTRLDATRDFQTDEAKVLKIVRDIGNVEIPRYNRKPFNATGVYFENKGRDKNKKYAIYSKQHDLIDKNASEAEIELARGLLRLEIQHKNNRAVSNLAKSLHLPNHNANNILTRQTSEKVIEKTMQLFSLHRLLENVESSLEKLAKNFSSAMPLTLAGHLLYKAQYGSDYGKLPFINLTEETIKKYERECAKTGILSL